jgi:hypothetical protein
MTKAAELAKWGEVTTNGQVSGRRNLIINGAMNVAQRGTSTSSYTADGYSVCDRWMYRVSGLGTWTISQDSSTPNGFGNSTKWDCTAADASPAVGDTLVFSQRLEGQDLQQLKKGLSDAENVTLSFYVNSVKTGTYIVELYDADNTRHISKSYTIDVANTWEYKTITFEGDTSGAFSDDNGRSLDINFWLGSGTNFTSGTLATSWASVTNANRAVGQVNLGDSTDNNFFITGVQMEVGSVATPFEHRSVGEELQLCRRYFQDLCSGASANPIANMSYYSATSSHGHIKLGTEMNSIPTISVADATHFIIYSAGAGNVTSALIVGGTWSRKAIELNATTAASTAGHSAFMRTNNTAASIQLDAEL